MAASTPIRFAVVGLGRAGNFHLTSMQIMGKGRSVLAWAIDTDLEKAQKVAAEHGAKAGTTLTEALQDPDVDAVIVASTTDTHFAFCKEALLANKALLTEKPISHDPNEVQEIIDLAKEKKKPFIVGYQRRVDKNFCQMRAVLNQGVVGGPRIIRCTSRDNPIPPLPYLQTSGGIFHDMLSHDFDMLNFLTGEMPISVTSIAHCYTPEIKAMDDVDTVVCMLDFESGCLATVDTSRVASYGYDQRVEVFGEKGMISMNNEPENTVEVATSSGFLRPVSEHSFPQRYKHTYTIELEKFVDMCQASPMVVEDDALIERHSTLEKVATGAELSWRLGRKVFISEVDDLRHHMPHGAHAAPNAA